MPTEAFESFLSKKRAEEAKTKLKMEISDNPFVDLEDEDKSPEMVKKAEENIIQHHAQDVTDEAVEVPSDESNEEIEDLSNEAVAEDDGEDTLTDLKVEDIKIMNDNGEHKKAA